MVTKSKADNVGIAVIGLGRGQAHVKSAVNATGGELVAVCDIKEDLVNEIAEQYQATPFTDYREMLKEEAVDLVCVCTPSGMHSDMIVDCANHGKHVMAEKPLDVTLDKIDKAVKACENNNVNLGCIFQNRLAPANLKIKDVVERGQLGQLILATAHVKWYRNDEYYEKNGGWRGTWDLDGGGSLMNQSVHTIDLMQWIMGPVKSVFAVTNVWSHDIETEDMGVALVKFANGAFGTIVGSTATYPGFGTSLEVHGVDGGICMSTNKITSWKIKGDNMDEEEEKILNKYGPEEKTTASGASDPNAIETNTTFIQVQDLVNAVKEKREPVISGKDGRAAVEIILAIYQSAQSGKEVFLPL